MSTETENGIQMTFGEYMPEIFPQQIAGASDSLVKISAPPESNLDLLATAQACFSELCTFLDNSRKKRNPLTCSLKTLEICLALMAGGISPGFSLSWTRGGYDAEWDVLNSKNFGVPQNRERVFIIGHLRNRGFREVFPVKGTDGQNNIHEVGHRRGYRRNTQIFDRDGITEALSTCQGGGREHHTIEIVAKTRPTKTGRGEDRERVIGCGSVCQTLRSTDYKDPVKVAVPVLTPDRAKKRQNGRRFKEDGDEMFTLTAQDRHGVAVGMCGFNVILNKSGNITDTAQALNARDYKGFSSSNQMMTGAAVCVTPHSFAKGQIQKKLEAAHCLSAEGPAKEGINTHQAMNRVAYELNPIGGLYTSQSGRFFRGILEDNARRLTGENSDSGVAMKVAGGGAENTEGGIYVKLSENCTVYAIWYPKKQCYIAIRKLTPKECFRLQGWTDDYFKKAELFNSDSQLYKQAGNGVTVNVIESIAKWMNDEQRESD